MANCRIQNLSPICGYSGDGVVTVMLLDFEDFDGFVFEEDAPYIENIVHRGVFITLDFHNFPAQYNGTLNAGIYSHGLEAFIPELSGPILADLHLATKRPQLVVFKTRSGKYFTFGHEKGAKVSYSVITASNTGAALTLTTASQYPLYEVSPEAFTEGAHPREYVLLFDDSAVCILNPISATLTGFQQATIALKVSAITGEPLDINDKPTAATGLRQAARALEFTTLPNIYALESYYPREGEINGEPSVQYAPNKCKEGEGLPWILDTGFWEMSSYWLNDGIWNY